MSDRRDNVTDMQFFFGATIPMIGIVMVLASVAGQIGATRQAIIAQTDAMLAEREREVADAD